MSVDQKPTDDVEWAEGGGALVDEPDDFRASGWPFGVVPPANHANWLQRSAGRWIKWLASKVDEHVHDGGTEPESVAKVDLTDHVDYGDFGEIEVTQDNNNLGARAVVHEITHRFIGSEPSGVARFITDQLLPDELLFAFETVTAPNFLQFFAEVLDFNDDLVALVIKAASTASADLVVQITGDVEASGNITAPNLVRAWVTFEGQASNGSFTPGNSYGIASVSRITEGAYRIVLDDSAPTLNDLVPFATVRDGQPGTGQEPAIVMADVDSPNTIDIQIFDLDKNYIDRDINLMVFY